ncbi:unnamed protein product [Sympodiomycopsis kandeliae]
MTNRDEAPNFDHHPRSGSSLSGYNQASGAGDSSQPGTQSLDAFGTGRRAQGEPPPRPPIPRSPSIAQRLGLSPKSALWQSKRSSWGPHPAHSTSYTAPSNGSNPSADTGLQSATVSYQGSSGDSNFRPDLPDKEAPPDLPPKAAGIDSEESEHQVPFQGDKGKGLEVQGSQAPTGPRAAKSFRRFFQSKAVKERAELEEDRQKRRRSVVELEGPSYDHPLKGSHSKGIKKNVVRGLKSLQSQRSQGSLRSAYDSDKAPSGSGTSVYSSTADPSAFLPPHSGKNSIESLASSSAVNRPAHQARTKSSQGSINSAPKSSVRSFGFNSNHSLATGSASKSNSESGHCADDGDSEHSRSTSHLRGSRLGLDRSALAARDADSEKHRLSPVLASPPPVATSSRDTRSLSTETDWTPRPGNHLQKTGTFPISTSNSTPATSEDIGAADDDIKMVTKANGEGTKNTWKLPFGRKGSSKNKQADAGEDWDDYQRGTATTSSRALPPNAQKDAKLMAMLGLDDVRGHGRGAETPTLGRNSRKGGRPDLMDELRDTGYLPRRSEHQPSGPKGSHKLERLLGSEAGSSTPNLAPHTPHTSSSHSGLGHSDSRSSTHSLPREAPMPLSATTNHSASSPSISHHHGGNESSANLLDSDCPVCLEPLSYRLAGEKPHVIPNCGHALHNACFTAVYGQPEAILAQQNRSGGAGGGPPGMCGVCRKAIVLGGDIEGNTKSSKLAGMMGMADLGSDRRRESDTNRERTEAGTDDPLDSSSYASFRNAQHRDQNGMVIHGSPSLRSLSYDAHDTQQQRQQAMVQPTIRVRPEYNTIHRKDPTGRNGKQNMVCVITIEIPSRRPPLTAEEEEAKFRQQWSSLQTIHDHEDENFDDGETENRTLDYQDESRDAERASGVPVPSNGSLHGSHDGNGHAADAHFEGDDGATHSRRDEDAQGLQNTTSTPPNGRRDDGATSPNEEGFSYGATPAANDVDPNAAVLDDLRQRIHDWKGQGIEKFGKLVLYDNLGVRQDTVVRNFWVYLFHDVLLCITQERRKERGLARLMSGTAASDRSGPNEEPGPHAPSSGPKPALKLKGRIWLRHIAKVKDSSVPGNFSLSIKLDDDSLDHFVLCLPDQPTLQIWHEKLTELVQAHKPGTAGSTGATSAPSVAGSAASGNTNSTRQNLRELPSSRAATDAASHELPPPSNTNLARRSTSGSASVASGKAGHSPQNNTTPSMTSAPSTAPTRRGTLVDSIRRSSRLFSASYSSGNFIPPQQQWSASGGLDPGLAPPPLLSHTPLDLVLMVSVPLVVQQQASGVSSSAAMKLRLIRSVLDFVISHMGPRDRVAIVTYSSGTEGEVRRTALLNVNRDRSRLKLADFVECIGKSWDASEEDPFRVDTRRLGGASERTDTVTALNVGLDVVLGRKSKNPCTGMILINDTSDGPVRGHMDLVMARAEAANVPIHCFGFGKSSNPSSLWLISNHTRGSYTFVREWFQLRECIAGCIGSLMSVALDQVKLHISLPGDNHFRVRKLAGLQGAIVSSSGKDVDIELGELRFGEVRELFVELELDFNGLVPFIAHDAGDGRVGVRRNQNAPAFEAGSATDDFMQRLGLNNLSLTDGSGDAMGVDSIENLIEEVAVFEVDAGFRDPALNVSLTRLSNPTVLTMEVDAHNPEVGPDGSHGLSADPAVTRRRIEILASDMITRSLLLVSRKNYIAALRIVNETHKIVETVVRSLSSDEGFLAGAASIHGGQASLDRAYSVNSNGHSSHNGGRGSKGFRSAPARHRAHLQRQAIASLLGIIEDLELMSDGLESDQRGQFDRDGRNSAAQQAMVLRDQQAWTTRTPTEALRFTSDNGPAFAAHAFAASRF